MPVYELMLNGEVHLRSNDYAYACTWIDWFKRKLRNPDAAWVNVIIVKSLILESF